VQTSIHWCDATGAGRRVVVGRDVHGLPEENEQRLDAAENLANALCDQGKSTFKPRQYFARCLQFDNGCSVATREHPSTLTTASKLPSHSIANASAPQPRRYTARLLPFCDGCWDQSTRTRCTRPRTWLLHFATKASTPQQRKTMRDSCRSATGHDGCTERTRTR
jgi:hypothetical protein